MKTPKNTYHKVSSYEAKENIDKVLLLYSGGLDTSVMVKWIQEIYGAEVYALTINVGQNEEDYNEIKQKALKLGAKKAILVNAQEEFANEYLSKAIKANVDYQHGYHLFCPLGRAVISKKAVEIAQKEGIKIIAHGSTGKGNDQVRFDSYITTLDPSIKIMAPVREYSMTRQEELKYAKKHNIPIKARNTIYSYDQNLWGNSAEGSEICDVKLIPKMENILIQNANIKDAINAPSTITLEFEKGIPTKLNGHKLSLVNLIKSVGALGAAHGVGTKILTEDRIVGLKVRGVYEEPAAAILVEAHKELEKVVSTFEENDFKEMVDHKWAALCYRAKWHEPLMGDLNALIDKQNEKVSGIVTIQVFKGNVYIMAIDSKYSLIDANMASFDTHEFNQQASAGFIEHYSFQQKMANTIAKQCELK
ncbi:MAG: argininosuccinate synthase [Candidatus Peregrinibacteria bacterium]|nr:argininosuccinate synthase [Candidatus Peregrinibacteria bacterium]